MNKNDESTCSSDTILLSRADDLDDRRNDEKSQRAYFTTKRTRTKFTLPVDLQNVRL